MALSSSAHFAVGLSAAFLSATWSASLGANRIVGRILRAAGYHRAASKRGLGFAITFFAFSAL